MKGSIPPLKLALLALSSLLVAGPVSAQTFGPEQKLSTSSSGARCVISADLDGDGAQDLVATEWDSGRIVWFRQTGPSTYAGAKVIDLGMTGALWLDAADLDGDGDVDLMATAWTKGHVVWYENFGGGIGFDAHILDGTASGASGVRPVDLDMDGDLDIVACSESTDRVSKYVNNGLGALGAGIVLNGSIDGAHSLGTGDVDMDGDADLVVGAWSSSTVYALPSNGAGGVGTPVTISGITGPACTQLFDMDGDGDLDILGCGRNSDEVFWIPNPGSGKFSSKLTVGIIDEPYWVEAGDIDDDGDLDVFVSASNADRVSMFEGLGAGSFSFEKSILTSADGARYVHVADLDADGDPDLATAQYFSNTISIVPNILQFEKPTLFEPGGLHCLETGTVVLTGEHLLGSSVTIDGVPVVVHTESDSSLAFDLGPDVPGGYHEVVLSSPLGTTEWPEGLVRYPALGAPEVVELGAAVEVVIENGEAGGYVLAFSGDLFASPAPFESYGWFHGLELNGVWTLAFGALAPGETSRIVNLTAPSTIGLVGVPLHLQAWTSQTSSGHAGFTPSVTVLIE
ncbi:MAG: VCBS repeat-containing protein [Planctomycetota bacterium]|nr:VCBS repeat-containing protein [Planctomycetota bacterium]